MKIVTIPAGILETNCYLVQPDGSRMLYIIDPGGDAPEIAQAAARIDRDRCAVLLTHAHVDHISGLGELVRLLKPEYVYLRTPDVALYENPGNALEPYLPAAENLPKKAVRPATLVAVDARNDGRGIKHGQRSIHPLHRRPDARVQILGRTIGNVVHCPIHLPFSPLVDHPFLAG